MPFTCSICGEESTRICRRCTKDACGNHICERCRRCSDCCECEVALTEPLHASARTANHAAAASAGPAPQPPHTPSVVPAPPGAEGPGPLAI